MVEIRQYRKTDEIKNLLVTDFIFNENMRKQPAKHGLYQPNAEHDACGVGFIANIKNRATHSILQEGLHILENMTHRGAVGANPTTGDGAGVLTQIPDAFFRAQGVALPAAENGEHAYGVAMLFMPQQEDKRRQTVALVEKIIEQEGLAVLAWRDVPTTNSAINDDVAASAPVMQQLFVTAGNTPLGDAFERRLYIVRKMFERAVAADENIAIASDAAGFYCASFSSRTIVYKGMFLAEQLAAYYPDLSNDTYVTALALVHQRFSTNTFPAWRLAHPYRFIAHNGEINTLRGNINNMTARHHSLYSPLFGEELEKLWPLMEHGQSDTATLDNAVELLCLAGYSPAHALAVLIPEAWQNNSAMPAPLVDFYRYHAAMMEPWDGPAEVVFTNGKQIGAVLDRNGLRPGRYWLTDDDRIIMASEAGVLPLADAHILRKWRIQPGKILLVDLEEGRLIDDTEVKKQLTVAHDYSTWAGASQQSLSPHATAATAATTENKQEPLLQRQQRFAYTEEDVKFVLRPMAEEGIEPTGSMGDDTPQAVLSQQMRPLSAYFRQEFAQVTNPPIDPIRESLVMSLNSYVGARPNLLSPGEAPTTCCYTLTHPILSATEFSALCAQQTSRVTMLDITYNESQTLAQTLEQLCEQARTDVVGGTSILVLSDKTASATRIAIPALLACAAVHHALVASGDRTQTGLVIETAAARSVHDMAVLVGYGAEAIYPYLAYETIATMPALMEAGEEKANLTTEQRVANYRQALGKGLLKVMSKMGISTLQSYCGAQIFEAVGLSQELIAHYFCGTESQIGGIGIDEIEREARYWHDIAKDKNNPLFKDALDAGGYYAYRTRGEAHLWSPESVAALQHAVRSNSYSKYEEYAALINEQSEQLMTLRGMLEIGSIGESIPLDEVEPAADILCRFSTGAMSFGSISHEAHSTLAIAMNRIGGKSNTGEGGEEAARLIPLANGDSMRSAIKQVASGRFGVTAEYLANSDMMQIKIAQGAKPGEGGQLPGHKVDSAIASVRHSVPGVGLISPPPHHDIYSIEDIAQLIYDLKCANPEGNVSVKLVSRAGVGTVAAGVAKAKSDHITIAGHDGGTGASPLSSIKHAGTPWELGLAETHQTLVLNDLRGRIALQVDGQIKTGRDVIIGALLGADEFGFATAPLVAEGCIMMRKCHLNTCPVGIATQDARLRKKFAGKPEHVINYFFFIAEEVRRFLAAIGVRRLNDIIGRADILTPKTQQHWKSKTLDLTPLLQLPLAPVEYSRFHCQRQDHAIEKHAIDYRWLPQARAAIDDGKPVVIEDKISNLHRTAGAVLSNAIAKKHGHAGLKRDLLQLRLTGIAGQSFGAFASRGMNMQLTGEANDYLGKGLSGGILAVRPPESKRPDGENIIAGNTALYGAICGEVYCRGVAGERFAVRNSGATAVVEGCGDHGCEYMTGGTVIVLGAVGRNFAAGMSGGVAYVWDENNQFADNCNKDMVDLRTLDSEPANCARHLQASDADIIRDFLNKHVGYTGSAKAQFILDHWETAREKFVKVIPYEYERALNEIREEKTA